MKCMGPVNVPSFDIKGIRIVPDARRRAWIRRWRTVIGFGGLTLAASFFFPAVEGCRGPMSPVGLVIDTVNQAQSNQMPRVELHEWLHAYLVGCGAYVIGGAVFLCMLLGLRSKRTLYAQQGRTLAILLVATLATTNIFLAIVTGHSLGKGYSAGEVYRDLCVNPGFPVLVIISCWIIACRRAGLGQVCLHKKHNRTWTDLLVRNALRCQQRGLLRPLDVARWIHSHLGWNRFRSKALESFVYTSRIMGVDAMSVATHQS